MTDSEIIKALQENEKPLSLTSKEMQAKALTLKRNDFDWYDGKNWYRYVSMGRKVDSDKAIRLRFDYKEEPEVKKCRDCKYYTDRCRNCMGLSGLPKWEAKEEPEIVKCGVYKFQGKFYYVKNSEEKLLYTASGYSDFIGFLYEGGLIGGSPRAYKHKVTGDIFWQVDFECLEDYEVLTPTYVCFRGKK